MHSTDTVHVARGTSYMIIQNMTTVTAMVVSFAVLARLITPREMGIWAVLLLVNSLCQILATLALPQAVTKFVAENLGRGDKDAAASVFYQAIRTTLVLAAPLGLIVLLGASVLSALLLGTVEYVMLFQFLAFDIMLSAGLLPVLCAAMLGLQKFKETAVVGIVSGALVRQCLIIILVIELRNLVGLVMAWVISDAISSFLYVALVMRELGPPRFEFALRELLKFSWPLCLGDAVAFGSAWFDRTILLIFVPLATLGVYNATITAFGVLGNISGAMASALLPAYSAIRGSNKRQTLSAAVRMASRYASIVGVPLGLGLSATAKPALTLFVGQAYIEGAVPLMILSGVFAFALVGTVLTPMLLALGETLKVSAITALSVLVSILAAFILLPYWGIVGAAVARGFAMILVTALTMTILTKMLALSLDIEAMWKSLVSGLVMAVVVLAMQIPWYDRFLLPIYALVGALTYLACLRILRALKHSDIELVRRYLGPRFQFLVVPLEKYLIFPVDE